MKKPRRGFFIDDDGAHDDGAGNGDDDDGSVPVLNQTSTQPTALLQMLSNISYRVVLILIYYDHGRHDHDDHRCHDDQRHYGACGLPCIQLNSLI